MSNVVANRPVIPEQANSRIASRRKDERTREGLKKVDKSTPVLNESRIVRASGIEIEGRLPPFDPKHWPSPGDWSWAPWYRFLFARLHNLPYYRYVTLWGGRAGGKSWALCEYIVRLAMMLRPGENILAIREVKESTKATIEEGIQDVVLKLGLASAFDFKTGRTMCVSGAKILYEGLNPSKPSSIEALKGTRNVQLLAADEAQMLSRDGLRLLLDTVVRERGSQAVFALNPKERAAPIQRDFVEPDVPEPSSVCIRVNWDSNPYHTHESESRRLMSLRREPERYSHDWLGECEPDDGYGAVVTRDSLEAALQAWPQRPVTKGETLRVGVDLGIQGKRSTATVFAVGGAVFAVHLDAPPTWEEFARLCIHRANALKKALDTDGIDWAYDSAGDQAASFRNAMERVGAQKRHYLMTPDDMPEHLLIPVLFGGRVANKDRPWESGGATNASVFSNRAAQLATVVSQRALNARAVRRGVRIDSDLCLFLSPDIDDLEGFMLECVTPRWKRTGMGRRALDKAAGGDDSPHRWDALALAFQRDSANGLSASAWTAPGEEPVDPFEEERVA